MADLKTRRTEPTSLRHTPTSEKSPPRVPRPPVARPPQPAPVETESAELSPALRTMQWVAVLSIVLTALWLMFATPAMDSTGGLAEAAGSSDTAPR